jgi:hypothetical protein
VVVRAIAVVACLVCSGRTAVAGCDEPGTAVPADTAIAAVIDANGGQLPANGDELWKALGKLDQFAQLPIPFSAARSTSSIIAPRVVIAPRVTGVGRADVTGANLHGRLFLAANMAKSTAEPNVTSIEFISWNTTRRRFDFGVIDNMDGPGGPQFQIVDGGKCFTCHKNRGPILGARPWSNTTHDDLLRFAVARNLQMSGHGLPQTGPFAMPQVVGGVPRRDRIDGMALATPEAAEVDAAVRLGAALRTNRDTFRLMTRTPDGRKGLVILLVALTEPGVLDASGWPAKHALDVTFDPTFYKFGTDWVELQKAAKPSALVDVDPTVLLVVSGVRQPSRNTNTQTVGVPGLVGGNGSRWGGSSRGGGGQTPPLSMDPAARAAAIQAAREKKAVDDFKSIMSELARYEAARAAGYSGLVSRMQPSNPRAFIKPPVSAPRRPSDVVNPLLLADTIGLTDGDRRFLARWLADAAKRVNKPKVTAPVLAQQVFEGPQFADVLAGGPLPDRDEFKDRFVAGLDEVLTATHGLSVGFAPDRREYASGPRYDPGVGEEREVAVVPTTACLRCHEVNGAGKAPRFDPIPQLAFDPFDKPGREAWVRSADPNLRRVVLGRLVERLVTDADMPPEDAPEADFVRAKEAAAFSEVKRFLTAEWDKVRQR